MKKAITKSNKKKTLKRPTFKVISSWDHGLQANQVAIPILEKKGSALDAVIEGCKLTELENG